MEVSGTVSMVWMLTLLTVVQPDCNPPNLTLCENSESPKFDEYVLWEKSFANRISCAVECTEDTRCVTFQYHPDRSLCRAFPVGIDVMEGESAPLFEGDTFMLKERVSGTWGSACAEGSVCSVTNTGCRDSKCLCEIGYRFNPKMSLCGKECATYGNDFTTHAQHVIYSYDNLCQDQVVSLTQCMEICRASDNCTSLDYNTDRNVCCQKSVGWFDVPEEDRDSDHPEWTFAQRNCKD